MVVGLVITSLFIPQSDAQSNIDGVQIGGNNSGQINNIINKNDITVTLPETKDQALLASILEQILTIQSSGDLEISQRGLDRFASEAANAIASQSLSRNVITDRQFTVRAGSSHSIAGTRNRVAFHGRGTCGNAGRINITFNGTPDRCFAVGEAKQFKLENQSFEMVLDESDRATYASFTIFPIN